MRRKFRVKFLFVGGLLFAVLLVSLQVFQPATASLSQDAATKDASTISQDDKATPIAEIAQPSSTAELKKEIETLTKIQDKLITNYIKLKRERDLAKERIKELQATSVDPALQGNSAEVDRLAQERDKFRREAELAQVQIEQLSQEKQGKLRISNELEVVNARTKSLQAEVTRLQSERSALEIELSKAKSELESTRTGRSALLQEAETLRSQLTGDKEKFAKGEAKLKQDIAKQTVEKQKLAEELRVSKAEKSALDAAIKSLRDEIAQGKSKLQESNQLAEKQKKEAIQAAEKQQQEIKKLNDEVAKLKQDGGKLDASLKAEIEAKKKLDAELANTKTLLAKRSEESDKLIAKVQELKGKEGTHESKLGLLQNEVKGQSSYIEQCDAQLSEARAKLIQVTELERQLVQLQNELLLKNTELEIYSSGNQAKPQPREQRRTAVSPAQAIQQSPRQQQTPPATNVLTNPEIITPSSTPSEMIIEITTSKGQLRAGPGKEQGVVMHVREGARLVVEDKQGEWYRVLTPTGTRAYVNQDIARVVGQSAGSPAVSILENRTPAKQPSNVFETNPDEVERAMDQLKRGVTGR